MHAQPGRNPADSEHRSVDNDRQPTGIGQRPSDAGARPPAADRHADHARHDPILVAGHAAGDLADASLILAERTLAACADCAALHADLRAIAAATRSLHSRTLVAPRDHRITAARADRLRRGGVWRRLLRPFAAGTLRPVAASMSALGVAGLVITLALPLTFGTASVALGPERVLSPVGGALPSAAPAAPAPGETGGPRTGGASDAGGPGSSSVPGAVTGLDGSNAPGPQYAGASPAPGDSSEPDGQVKGTDRGSPEPIAGPSQVTPGQGAPGAGNEAPGSGQEDVGAIDDRTLGNGSVSPIAMAALGSLGLLLVGLVLLGLRTLARRATR